MSPLYDPNFRRNRNLSNRPPPPQPPGNRDLPPPRRKIRSPLRQAHLPRNRRRRQSSHLRPSRHRQAPRNRLRPERRRKKITAHLRRRPGQTRRHHPGDYPPIRRRNIRALRKHRIPRAAVCLPEVKGISADVIADAVATGLSLAAFDYREFKGTASKEKEKDPPKKFTITLFTDKLSDARPAVDRSKIVSTAQNFARTIASRPGNNINPPSLAKVAQAMSREAGLRCTIMDEKQLARLGMGGILAVGGEASKPLQE